MPSVLANIPKYMYNVQTQPPWVFYLGWLGSFFGKPNTFIFENGPSMRICSTIFQTIKSPLCTLDIPESFP